MEKMEKQVEKQFIKLRQERARKVIVGVIVEVIGMFFTLFYSTAHPEAPALLHALCKTSLIVVVLSLPLIIHNFIQSEEDDYIKAQNEATK